MRAAPPTLAIPFVEAGRPLLPAQAADSGRTHCPYCALQCGIRLGGPAGEPTLAGDPDFPVNQGTLCIKGWTDRFAIGASQAGLLAALATFIGSATRPLGGWVADRVGGARLLTVALATLAGLYAAIGQAAALTPTVARVVAAMACFGLGNGAVFQLVPQSFAGEIGVATGVVGAVGGLGGFFLPMLLGAVREYAGSYQAGFVLLGAAALAAVVALRVLALRRPRWRSRPIPLAAGSLESA